MSDVIHVRYTKWDGTLHWHFDAVLMDRDHHGTWLLVEPGTEYRRGQEPGRIDEHGFVLLIPEIGWWSAYFNAVPRRSSRHLVYVDINSAARWEGNTVSLIDLDLDVTLAPDGLVTLLDEDEFEAHQDLYGYPQDLVEKTRATAADVFDAISRGDEPFGGAGFGRVADQLGWAPGKVVEGHGAASGSGGDVRFPQGTLVLQFPHFARAGVAIEGYMPATINVDLPFELVSRNPMSRIEHLEWLDGYPTETFEFFESKIAVAGVAHRALVYRPDPATKPEFTQPGSVVEVLAPPIEGISPGTPVSVWVDPVQAGFEV